MGTRGVNRQSNWKTALRDTCSESALILQKLCYHYSTILYRHYCIGLCFIQGPTHSHLALSVSFHWLRGAISVNHSEFPCWCCICSFCSGRNIWGRQLNSKEHQVFLAPRQLSAQTAAPLSLAWLLLVRQVTTPPTGWHWPRASCSPRSHCKHSNKGKQHWWFFPNQRAMQYFSFHWQVSQGFVMYPCIGAEVGREQVSVQWSQLWIPACIVYLAYLIKCMK